MCYWVRKNKRFFLRALIRGDAAKIIARAFFQLDGIRKNVQPIENRFIRSFSASTLRRHAAKKVVPKNTMLLFLHWALHKKIVFIFSPSDTLFWWKISSLRSALCCSSRRLGALLPSRLLGRRRTRRLASERPARAPSTARGGSRGTPGNHREAHQES